MKKLLCVLLLVGFSFMAFGCSNSQVEENEWLKKSFAEAQAENKKLQDEINELKAELRIAQNGKGNKIQSSDLQFILECYGEVCYELEKTADEIGALAEELEYADTQAQIDSVRMALDALQNDIYDTADEYGNIYSQY